MRQGSDEEKLGPSQGPIEGRFWPSRRKAPEIILIQIHRGKAASGRVTAGFGWLNNGSNVRTERQTKEGGSRNPPAGWPALGSETLAVSKWSIGAGQAGQAP